MSDLPLSASLNENDRVQRAHPIIWAIRVSLLWKYRHLLASVTAISLVLSLCIAFAIPKRYKSTARIMPPDQQTSGAMMLAALAGRTGGLGALSSLAGGREDCSGLYERGDYRRNTSARSQGTANVTRQTLPHRRRVSIRLLATPFVLRQRRRWDIAGIPHNGNLDRANCASDQRAHRGRSNVS